MQNIGSVDFFKRSLTGLVIVLVILSVIYTGSVGVLILCIVIDVTALLEFYKHYIPGSSFMKPLSCLVSVAAFAFVGLEQTMPALQGLWVFAIPSLYLLFIAEVLVFDDHPVHVLAFSIAGFVWITIPLILFYLCCFINGIFQMEFALAYFAFLWAHDTSAYLCGRMVGRTPLYEVISPKKTIEGSAGGFLATICVSIILSRYSSLYSTPVWVAMALTIAVTGTFGDLAKSMMKRSLHIKDTGAWLPGHGGTLDRFDSLIGSAPFVFFLIKML